jgi:hypothetical protein
MLDLSALMATDDLAREIRTRAALDSQGALELSVSYEVQRAHDPLPLVPSRPFPPLSARCNFSQVEDEDKP